MTQHMNNRKVECSFFSDLYTTTPEQCTLSWQELVDRFTQGHWPEKRGPLWSPVTYKQDATRSSETVAALSCFVLDSDDGTDPGVLTPRWDELGLAYIVHSSFNHQREKNKDGKEPEPAQPRWRAVFLLSEPVSPDNWPETYQRVATYLADDHWCRACSNPDRMYYEPAAAPGAERFAFSNDGRALDLDEAPELPEPPEGKMPRYTPPVSGGPAERPGDDYSQRGDHRAVLLDAGWEYVTTKGSNECWRRPGKRHGTSATWHTGRRVFYCFTSSAAPLEPNQAYSLFSLRAALEGWDYSELARQLRAEGYGGSTDQSQTSQQDTREEPLDDEILEELRQVAPERAEELLRQRAAKRLALYGITGVLRREVPEDPTETRYIVELVGGRCTEALTYPRLANWYNFEAALVHATGKPLPEVFSTLSKAKKSGVWRRLVLTLLSVARVEQLDVEAGEAGAIREAVLAYLAVSRSEWDETQEPAEAPFPFLAPGRDAGQPCVWLRLDHLMKHVRQAVTRVARPAVVNVLQELGGYNRDRPALPTRDRDGQVRQRPVRGRVWIVPIACEDEERVEALA